MNYFQLGLVERDGDIFLADRAEGSVRPATFAEANAQDGAAERALGIDVTFIIKLIFGNVSPLGHLIDPGIFANSFTISPDQTRTLVSQSASGSATRTSVSTRRPLRLDLCSPSSEARRQRARNESRRRSTG